MSEEYAVAEGSAASLFLPHRAFVVQLRTQVDEEQEFLWGHGEHGRVGTARLLPVAPQKIRAVGCNT